MRNYKSRFDGEAIGDEMIGDIVRGVVDDWRSDT